MSKRQTRSSKRNQIELIEKDVTTVKRTRRQLKYNTSSKLDEENDSIEDISEFLTTPYTGIKEDVNPSIILSKTNVDNCILFQIPKSVSFEIMSYLNAENFVSLEVSCFDCLSICREDVQHRILSLYHENNIPLSQFSETSFWNHKWWLTNVVTGKQYESPHESFEKTRGNHIQSPSLCLSPCSTTTNNNTTSMTSPGTALHLNRSATKVLDIFKNDSFLKRDLYGSGESFLSKVDDHTRRCGMTRKPGYIPKVNVDRNSNTNSSSSSSGSSSNNNNNNNNNGSNSSSSSSSNSFNSTPRSSLRKVGRLNSVQNSADWLQELSKWDKAMHVPRDGSLQKVLSIAPSGSHIMLSPGVHVLDDLLVVSKSVQIIGALNEKNMPMSIIKGSNGVFRVAYSAHLSLFGVGIWCYSSDFSRRNAITIDAHSTFFASFSQIKCVSGRYCGGMLVQAEGSALLCDSSVSACTGSGVILFGVGQFEHCDIFDNHFNGIEVQKGGEAYMSACHVHSNGYCSNEEDLGSGVTCCGSTSMVWLKNSFVHGNQGGGLIVQSAAKAIAQGCQLSMNHAGHEFGDLDVDTDSDVVLEYCLLKGNGQHGREQYSVVCAQRNSQLTMRHCYISCEPISFGTGIDVQNGAEIRLEKCHIYKCSGSGVLLRDANVTVYITQSKLYDNKLHGVEVQAGDVNITHCDISNNTGHDIYISETNGECKYVISKTTAPSFSVIDDNQYIPRIEGVPFDATNK